ncbi:MAG: EscU/YscU/HrcU family type III secretion system export apparatus switch protein, partial [Psychrosphaera sp.]|nr:EscU/YscU/HrcU family type III secretion system export apparatus switch protein [Psychrosphaera sp.]
MADNDAGERTEQATPKHAKEAREKGQVARSKELTTAVLLMTASTLIYVYSERVGQSFSNIALRAFTPTRKYIFSEKQMISSLGELFFAVAVSVAPLFIILWILALVAPTLTGGLTFSFKAASPKMNRMSISKGFKRMFGLQALVEFIKAIAKVSLVL